MNRRKPTSLMLALLSVCFMATSTNADDWSEFRGPNGTGVSTSSVPTTWSPTENVKWKSSLPGSGVSSPIVVGDKVFLTSYSGYGLDRGNPGDLNNLKRHVLCISRADGKLLWEKTIEAYQPEDTYTGIGVTAHGYASSTPASDGENVYVFLGKSGVFAYDLDGKELWQTSVGTGSDSRRWGSASSPILYKNLVIIPAIAESMAMVALDKKTGKEVWKEVADGYESCWGTPVIAEVDGRQDLIMGVPYEIWGMNPENGKLRWISEGVNNDSFYTSLSVDNGVVYGSASGRSGGGSVAVKLGGGKGDLGKRMCSGKAKTKLDLAVLLSPTASCFCSQEALRRQSIPKMAKESNSFVLKVAAGVVVVATWVFRLRFSGRCQG